MEFVPIGMSHANRITLLIRYFIDNLKIQSVPCQNNYKLEIYGAHITKRGPRNSAGAENTTSEDDFIEA